MDYAMGTGHDREQPYAAALVLPAPKPTRMHWSTLLLVAGMAVCSLGLLATIAGVPARMGYDADGAPNRNKPSSNDPMKVSASLDGNMKWIDEASSERAGGYVSYIQSINRSEGVIAPMVAALGQMDASVKAIDAGLGEVGATTRAMRANMAAMAEVSAASSDTMQALGEDIGFLSGSMLELAGSTQELTEKMARIERQARAIATGGTAVARGHAADLNAALPPEVPAPQLTDVEAPR